MYTVDYFISKFEAIPEDKWCVDFTEDYNGNRCALGHCGGINTHESNILRSILCMPVSFLNDGLKPEYPQPTPKQRILAALYDIRAKESKPDDTWGKVKEEETFKPVEIKSEFIPVTFKEIKIPEHSIN